MGQFVTGGFMDQNRRDLIKGGIIGAGIVGAPAVHAQKKYKWRMATSWPKNFPGIGRGPWAVKRMIEGMSNGQLEIEVLSAGELKGYNGLQIQDAVSKNDVEMGHTATYYWSKKHPATNFFSTVPFGLNSHEMKGWLQYGGGQELWDEFYAGFNLVGFATGNTGVQMGGWFRKKVTNTKQLKGLKMRIPGLGGDVLKQFGVNTVNLPGGKIYGALKANEIDATEWVGPLNDLQAKFHEVAKYYYWPGWHEPATAACVVCNKKQFDALPKHLQMIIKEANNAAYLEMLSDHNAANSEALIKLVKEHKVQLQRFSDKMLAEFGKASKEIVENVAKHDAMTQKIYDSYNKYRSNAVWWNKIGDEGYGLARSLTFSF